MVVMSKVMTLMARRAGGDDVDGNKVGDDDGDNDNDRNRVR